MILLQTDRWTDGQTTKAKTTCLRPFEVGVCMCVCWGGGGGGGGGGGANNMKQCYKIF